MINAAIAEETTVRDVERAVHDGERGTLAVDERIERKLAGAHAGNHVDRPACARRAVVERKRVDESTGQPGEAGRLSGGDGVEVERARREVDDRRAGDTERADVATAERDLWGGGEKLLVPNRRARRSVEDVHAI